MKKKIALGIVILLIVLVGGFVAWSSITNPVMAQAMAALQSDAQVQVTSGADLVFQPTAQTATTGYIFYPGGKVDYRSYAPYAHALAAQGYLVVIAHMPLNLAVFDINAAAGVMAAHPQVKVWALGGHSLGGSMAANFIAKHPGAAQGLVLLASYPAASDNLSATDVKVLSISAEKDGLATADKVDAARPLLPTNTRYLVIAGGNHGQFGWYGLQSGDGAATTSREDQQQQTTEATATFLQDLAGK